MFSNEQRKIITTSKAHLSITIQAPADGHGSALVFPNDELVHNHLIGSRRRARRDNRAATAFSSSVFVEFFKFFNFIAQRPSLPIVCLVSRRWVVVMMMVVAIVFVLVRGVEIRILLLLLSLVCLQPRGH
jgi:hypothetical protein